MNIVILAGGLSPERDVSISSGSLIANSLAKSGHSVFLLDVYEGLTLTSQISELFSRNVDYKYKVEENEPDLEALKSKYGSRKALIGKNVLEICSAADIVFIALHGAMGENGQLQATFDNYGIKYTGSGYIGSLLAMDKDITKRLLVNEGINTAKWLMFDFACNNTNDVENAIGYPCVVKPCSCGSSVGVSRVNTRDELENALALAAKYESKILIEKKITGREFSLGILNDKPLPPIEIIPQSGFYDYKNKYQSGLTKEVAPADLSEEDTARIQSAALKVHNTLHLKGYSRIDFILDEETNEFVCLEANTLPGMTPTSLLPQEANAAGISYDELCEMIVNYSLKN